MPNIEGTQVRAGLSFLPERKLCIVFCDQRMDATSVLAVRPVVLLNDGFLLCSFSGSAAVASKGMAESTVRQTRDNTVSLTSQRVTHSIDLAQIGQFDQAKAERLEMAMHRKTHEELMQVFSQPQRAKIRKAPFVQFVLGQSSLVCCIDVPVLCLFLFLSFACRDS